MRVGMHKRDWWDTLVAWFWIGQVVLWIWVAVLIVGGWT